MTGWIVAGTFYVVGVIGIHTMATDLNRGPIRTWRARLFQAFWPLHITYGFVGGIYEGCWRHPKWPTLLSFPFTKRASGRPTCTEKPPTSIRLSSRPLA